MSFPGSIYAPPGVYTQTNYEDPLAGLAATLRVPLMIGTGSEVLFQDGLTVVRGSSSSVDQKIVQEDEAGRAVVSVTEAGFVTLGAFNGVLDRIQVKNFPIVTGAGSGTTSNSPADVSVTINGDPVVVLGMTGANGILQLATPPELSDEVRVTYFFNRTDTLITDTLSDQISPTAPQLYGSAGESYIITEGANDTLSFTVDSTDSVSVTISPSPLVGWTAAQIASFINSAALSASSSLVAGTAVDSFGNVVVSLTADRDIEVGEGLANTTLGLTAGVSTGRNKVFYVFQRPVVNGSNAGDTTNIVSDVTVEVDNVQVVPDSLDGLTGAVTLPFAPAVGSVVTCRYYFNSWQDTFDYLAHRNVLAVQYCGYTVNTPDFIEGVDFVLQDDKIMWGAASLIDAGVHTTGSEYFDSTQVVSTLVDTRNYMTLCTQGDSQVNSRTDFTIPLQATTGNGRNNPLGSETYEEVANGRHDWPTNRPDLIFAYWGYSVEDALNRGRVEVTKVDSSSNAISLREAVPVGANVYATFYYNTLVDAVYSLSAATEGGSGSGTYTVANAAGTALLTPTFGTKSAALATVSINFPSGSENMPDCRFESPFDTTSYVGPVEEDVTVTFATQDATLAKYTVPSSGPYYMDSGNSDHFDLEVDASALTGGFVDLSAVNAGETVGFSGYLLGDEISYDGDSGDTTYDITSSNNALDVTIDGVEVAVKAPAAAGATVAEYILALNQGTLGVHATSDWGAGPGAAIAIPAADSPSDEDDYYVGWQARVHAGTAAGVDVRTVTDYDAATRVCTLDGGAYDNTSEFHLYNPAAAPVIRSRPMKGSFTIAVGEFDDLPTRYVDAGGAAAIALTVTPGTYTNLSDLADQITTDFLAALGAVDDPIITCTANSSDQLEFSMVPAADQATGGYWEFVTAASTAASFARLAGLDAAAAGGTGQTKLVNCAVARRFTVIGVAPTGNLVYDRIILRNRILPGQAPSAAGSASANRYALSQCALVAKAGTGLANCGLSVNDAGDAGLQACILPPSIVTEVSRDGVDAGTSEPYVTLYQTGGTTAQNNTFTFSVDGTPVSLEFTDSAGVAIASGASADVPFGPIGTADTILNQIQSAMTTAGLAAAQIVQEGVGFRLVGTQTVSSASIVIGGGLANGWMSQFSEGSEAYRTEVSPGVVASALMSHEATVAAATLTWAGGSSAGYFPAVALAQVVSDSANRDYLYLQSQGGSGLGTTSSLEFADAATDSVTRPGTGLGVQAGFGNAGESAIQGFVVQSSDTVNGSGTANTSPFSAGALTAGIGQEGEVGQTYRDLVTGLTFSILPRDGGAVYPVGATFTIPVRSSVTCDSNIPVNTIPGIALTVSNTLDITVGDTCLVSTYIPGGAEPDVGEYYSVTYSYAKQDFSPAVYTKMASVEAAYGTKGVSNPVSLAAYLAFLNGAVVLAIKQVQKDADADGDGTVDSASYDAYIEAINDVEGPLPGGSYPDMLVPLKSDSLTLYQYLARHCDVQSSIRYRSERTAICGTSAGTLPAAAGEMAEGIARTRLRLCYPDIYTVSLTTFDGTVESTLVDGSYMAAAVAGNRAAPAIDVATPWTGARIIGFDKISRSLDAVEENQVAVRGVTVISQNQSVVSVRQGLTTDMANVLTKTPTVITIADEVQRQARVTLSRFIGQKFLSGMTAQIETQLSATLKTLSAANIIAAFTGVKAQVSPDDPTVAEVEAFYQPVFPLLYIVCTFNVRSQL